VACASAVLLGWAVGLPRDIILSLAPKSVTLLGPVRGRQDWADRGFALGTVSHGIGAARAIQVNADAGAYAGLALGLQVILASLLIPVAFRLAAGLGGS
ncbi:LrgB family protein, partial [Bordetella pertussis]|uniref:LrgB family protein n=1 Tax=Bordetella pertussis TaxID=520 RepID=UPI000AB47E94